jgi:hypothetical protein
MTDRSPQQLDDRALTLLDEMEAADEGRAGSGGGSGCRWAVIGMLGCLTIPLVALAAVVFMGFNTLDGVLSGVHGIFNPPPPVYRTVSSALILDRVQSLSQLTTVRYNFSNIVTSERELPALLQTLYRDRLVMVVVGHITAGIDLNRLTQQDIVITEDSVTIQLPGPVLRDCFINEGASYVIERDTGLFARSAPQLDGEARRFAIREFREAALEENILHEANNQAVVTIGETIGLLADVIAPEQPLNVRVIPGAPDPQAPLPDTCR